MPISSIFKRKAKAAGPAGPAAGEDAHSVQQARQRARRRLIGAALLLAAGVVVFPLLFETQPRPLPSGVPVEEARTAAALPPAGRAAESPPPAVANAASQTPADPTPVAAGGATTARAEPPAAAAVPVSAPPAAPGSAAALPARAVPAKATVGTAASAAASAVAKAVPARPAASRPAAGASAPRDGRFVVQVGAYTDPATLRDVRAKVEKLGLATYTQTIDTEAGKRTRVRVGPYASRQEAEAASAKLKAAGLPGNVLTL